MIAELDEKKREALEKTWRKVNQDFGSIFSTLLPGTAAKLDPVEGHSFLDGKVSGSGLARASQHATCLAASLSGRGLSLTAGRRQKGILACPPGQRRHHSCRGNCSEGCQGAPTRQGLHEGRSALVATARSQQSCCPLAQAWR